MNSQTRKKSKSWNSKEEAAFVELWEKKVPALQGARKNDKNDVYSDMAYQMRQWRNDMRIVDVKHKLFNLIKKYKQYKQDLASGAYPASWPLYERIHRILNSTSNADVIYRDIEEIDYDSNLEESSEHSCSPCQSPSASNSTLDNTFQEDENSLLSSTFNALKSSHENGKKRRRRGPQQSWQMEEEKELIAFLKDNKDSFEKPTAQRFYTEFLQISSFYREWKTVCNKVRNMRLKYEKAKAFLKSPDPSLMHKGETLRGTMYRMCYYFRDFREIFKGNELINYETSDAIYEKDIPNAKTASPTQPPSQGITDGICSEDNSSEHSSILKGKKRKRSSRGLHKIWAQEEEKEIAIFLKENKQFFEKPTAIRFYESFLKNSNIEVGPEIVRSKVRNMRTKYEKAKLFLKSPDTNLMQRGETIRDTALRLCHYLEEFQETFDGIYQRDVMSGFLDNMNEANAGNTEETSAAPLIIKDVYSIEQNNNNNNNNNDMNTDGDKEIYSEDNSIENFAMLEKSSPRLHKFWSQSEEKEIITFLKQNKHSFEKPTNKEFYTKLLKSTEINAELNTLREKVRNMRMKYVKACLFLKCPDASFIKEGETELDVAKRFCYFYEDFKEIFDEDNSRQTSSFHSDRFNEGEKNDSITRQDVLQPPCTIRVKKIFSQIPEEDPLSGLFVEDSLASTKPQQQHHREQIDNDREMCYLQVREKEIESNERIKKMELEMKERIAMREIEMKEKLAIKELEICEKYIKATGENGEIGLEKHVDFLGETITK